MLSGRTMDVSAEHAEKTSFPRVVTLDGMLIEVREEHPAKALS